VAALLRIVEDEADGVASTRTNLAHTMAESDPIRAT
jgi:hypothetical protein